MQNNFKYINLSWAVVGICENTRQPLWVHILGIDKDEAAAVEHYVIGYMAFLHIAFVDEDCLVPCNDDALRNDARRKIDRYIADHPPVETFPRFYLVLLPPKCYKPPEHLFRLSPQLTLFRSLYERFRGTFCRSALPLATARTLPNEQKNYF